jgi:hypothetical protein
MMGERSRLDEVAGVLGYATTPANTDPRTCPACGGALGWQGSSCDTCNQAMSPGARLTAFESLDPPSTWGDVPPWDRGDAA